ncbi:unnamed protein product [Cochlearia groenlandica]
MSEEPDARAKPEPEHRATPEPEHRATPEPEHRATPEPEHRAKPEPEHQAKPEPKHRAKPEPDAEQPEGAITRSKAKELAKEAQAMIMKEERRGQAGSLFNVHTMA